MSSNPTPRASREERNNPAITDGAQLARRLLSARCVLDTMSRTRVCASRFLNSKVPTNKGRSGASDRIPSCYRFAGLNRHALAAAASGPCQSSTSRRDPGRRRKYHSGKSGASPAAGTATSGAYQAARRGLAAHQMGRASHIAYGCPRLAELQSITTGRVGSAGRCPDGSRRGKVSCRPATASRFPCGYFVGRARLLPRFVRRSARVAREIGWCLTAVDVGVQLSHQPDRREELPRPRLRAFKQRYPLDAAEHDPGPPSTSITS